MARRAQTETAVLGALSVEPMTGYAVRAAITTTLGHFWSESFGQIYPTLDRLSADGLVVHGADKRFTITDAGLTRLRELLCEPIEPAPARNGLLLRLFFGRMLGRDVCIQLLEEARSSSERSLETMAAIRAGVESETGSPDQPFFLVTIAAGEAGARAQIEWATESMELLRR
ncbi:PadR family transcriptional regulator [Cellulomonas sp. URHE0023]|uniref:PadR family transcriptional regulator n=1 Tax=Cellulomonas sp. URHE0023 TaxID=1380354 RepID=UPI0004804E5D|nr:PadR family transcriptional regulator [Cellulomonas sp. URHE0023]